MKRPIPIKVHSTRDLVSIYFSPSVMTQISRWLPDNCRDVSAINGTFTPWFGRFYFDKEDNTLSMDFVPVGSVQNYYHYRIGFAQSCRDPGVNPPRRVLRLYKNNRGPKRATTAAQMMPISKVKYLEKQNMKFIKGGGYFGHGRIIIYLNPIEAQIPLEFEEHTPEDFIVSATRDFIKPQYQNRRFKVSGGGVFDRSITGLEVKNAPVLAEGSVILIPTQDNRGATTRRLTSDDLILLRRWFEPA